MKVLVWNCQGAGSPLTIPQLKEANNLLSPNLIFLCETKNKAQYMEQVKRRLHFEGCYVVEAMKRSGGMALLWHEDIKIKMIQHTSFTIEVQIQDTETQTDWWFIGIYASCWDQMRKQQWKDNAKLKISSIKKQLEEVQRDGGINGKMKKKELKGQLKQAYMEEELYWSQKARCKWLKHGDKNTQFFHANVRGRRKKNRMQNIQRDDGSWAVSEEDLGAEIARYYQQLFSGAEVDCLDEILEGIPQSISQQMNAKITRKVQEGEIKKAVFSMDPNTGPGSDGLTNLIQKATRERKITGMKICRGGPAITHLFFADDAIIFSKADPEEALTLMNILKQYERGSGQMLNLDKSSVFFSKNISQQQQREVCRHLGNIQRVHQGKYLGLPMVITRSKRQVFSFIKEKCEKKMQHWKNKLLSTAGKEVLLKAVTMAMPTYAMSCFKLPVRLCRELSSLMANYWWGEEQGKRKMHWCSWQRITLDRKKGGLGFKDLLNFNKALLGKQIWRLITRPNSLVSNVLKTKYFPKSTIFNCQVQHNSSWIWQSIMAVREDVQRGLIRKIGNGRSTKIWDDNWVPEIPHGRPASTRPRNCNLHNVADLIQNFRWKRALVFKLFKEEEAKMILRIPISLANREDGHFWLHSRNGQYTVASAYKELNKKGEEQQQKMLTRGETSLEDQHLWKHLWKLKVKHKLKIFIWKCLNKALPVNEVVFSRTKKGSPICENCGEAVETVEHLLFRCRMAEEAWQIAPLKWDGIDDQQGNFKRWWNALTEARNRPEGLEHIALTVNILWQIWKARNDFVFQKNRRPASKIIHQAQEEWLEMQRIQHSKDQMSIPKTTEAVVQQAVTTSTESPITICLAFDTQRKASQMGIGIVAVRGNDQVLATWAVKEYSTGNILMDTAVAIKLAMIKAREQQWRRIQVAITQRQLLKMIETKRATDIRLHSHIEDIYDLSSMFVECSFVLARGK
nr:uncharacterized protein LOC113708329 [Coffea arabica]